MISIYENCVWLKKEGKASKESLQSDKILIYFCDILYIFCDIIVLFYTRM